MRFPSITEPFGNSEEAREKTRLFYWISGLFIAFNGIFIYYENYTFLLVPAALLIVALIFLKTEVVFFAAVFFTPLSVNIRDIGMGFGISLPAEPLIIMLLAVFGLKLLLSGNYEKKLLVHPVSIFILLHLLWMGLTSVNSTMPMVSFKFFLSRIWFVLVFYFFALHVFRKTENRKRFLWLYILPLTAVIIITIWKHYQLGFDEKVAHWIMDPFFNDHTAYAAAISMFLPALVLFAGDRTTPGRFRIFSAFLFLLFLVAISLSFTRAAWVSIAVSLVCTVLFLLKIKFRTILIASVTMITLFLVFQQEIFQRLERNRQDSSRDFSRHIQSISNISTDASNLERINRWHSAWRMFLAKPFAGFGPGTYQFQYAPFQRSNEKTIISTNSGTKGTAHSEYLGPLAEEGVLGLVLFALIVIFVICRAAMIWSRSSNNEIRGLTLVLLLGLITYFVHGLMNNFLDTDKASVPFWGFISMIVAMDIEEFGETQ